MTTITLLSEKVKIGKKYLNNYEKTISRYRTEKCWCDTGSGGSFHRHISGRPNDFHWSDRSNLNRSWFWKGRTSWDLNWGIRDEGSDFGGSVH